MSVVQELKTDIKSENTFAARLFHLDVYDIDSYKNIIAISVSSNSEDPFTILTEGGKCIIKQGDKIVKSYEFDTEMGIMKYDFIDSNTISIELAEKHKSDIEDK